FASGGFGLGLGFGLHALADHLLGEQGGEVGLIVYCPHGPDDGCECRKPKPGMLRQIGEHYGVDLSGIWFVGDSIGDLEAARECRRRPRWRGGRPPPSHVA
ncbi:HAD-IIIA family hydrolase, partial [Pseudomonas aeruginosa]|uniref:HAD-IIIA family hydrolase n=1 Tax=Pseudomonas aeruginosa TaxID=287 RepID=UPI0031B6F6D6